MKIQKVNKNTIFKELNETLESKREKRILSIEGEKESERLASNKVLQRVNKIYTSNYVMSIATAKYLAHTLEIDMNIAKELGERVIGNLQDKKIRMVTEMQENDFNYRLSGGESLNDVKKRMHNFLKKVLNNDKDKTIAVFTHNVAITSLLTEYCEKGFNLDNRLILNYQEESIVDGTWTGIRLIEMVFDNTTLVSLKRLQ